MESFCIQFWSFPKDPETGPREAEGAGGQYFDGTLTFYGSNMCKDIDL